MRKVSVLLLLVLGAARCVAAADQLPPKPRGPMLVAFVGDVPYHRHQRATFDHDVEVVASRRPAPDLFIHLGDIGEGPCGGSLGPCEGDAIQPCEPGAEPHSYIAARMEQLERAGIPALVLPGDNETTDCTSDPAAAWRLWDAKLGGFVGGSPDRRVGRSVSLTRGELLVLGLSLPNPPGDEVAAAMQLLEQALRPPLPPVRGVLIAAHSFKSIRAELPRILARVPLPVLLVQGDKHQLFWAECPCLAGPGGTPAPRQLLIVGGELDYCGVDLVGFDEDAGRFTHGVERACAVDDDPCFLCDGS